MDAEERRRRLACCDSKPRCQLCPLRAENQHRSIRDLALAAVRGED